jgi:aromatic ring hydroxylase
MRTSGDYRKALRDGRKVWVMGEGWVDDVTTHPLGTSCCSRLQMPTGAHSVGLCAAEERR